MREQIPFNKIGTCSQLFRLGTQQSASWNLLFRILEHRFDSSKITGKLDSGDRFLRTASGPAASFGLFLGQEGSGILKLGPVSVRVLANGQESGIVCSCLFAIAGKPGRSRGAGQRVETVWSGAQRGFELDHHLRRLLQFQQHFPE